MMLLDRLSRITVELLDWTGTNAFSDLGAELPHFEMKAYKNIAAYSECNLKYDCVAL